MYLFYLAGVVKNIGSLTTSSETAGAMPSSLSNFSPTAETLCSGHFLGNKKADFKPDFPKCLAPKTVKHFGRQRNPKKRERIALLF